jgi:DNA-binding GntR family transcriptional regulator
VQVLDKEDASVYTMAVYNIEYRETLSEEGISPVPMSAIVRSSAIAHRNVYEAVVDGIRDMIFSDQLKPGDWLRQDELAETFGVSTMPVREALRQLQAEGLVTLHRRRGAAVVSLSVSECEEIYCIREALETLAVRWAAENFERMAIGRLYSLLGEIEAAEARFDDVDRRLHLVREFFFTIFQASEKEHLLRMLSNLWDLSHHYRRHFSSLPELVPQRVPKYRKLYRACHARDAEGLTAAFRAIWAVREPTLIPLIRQESAKT